MNDSSPFDHDSFIYRLMKYLYRVDQQLEKVSIVWILIDLMQFLTIIASLLGEVLKTQYSLENQGLLSDFLNIFCKSTTIFNWLVISGSVLAMNVILGLLVYLIIQLQQKVSKSNKNRTLKYTALLATISIGLFEFFYQVVANNLINIVKGIFNKDKQVGVDLIVFGLLNVFMMLFVSVFNYQKRIFRFALVMVCIGLNVLPFTIACVQISLLSLYFQRLDKAKYKVTFYFIKKLFYFLIVVTCVQSAFQMNDTTDYFIGSRFIYLGISWVGVIAYFFYYRQNFMEDSIIEQNKYLVALYKKKLKKQDKKQDFLLADLYFTQYYEKQADTMKNDPSNKNRQFYLTQSVQQWQDADMKDRIIEKIRNERKDKGNAESALGEIYYFQFLVELKVNMISLLKQVFQYMSQKRNESIQVIYQINKLTNKIKKQFKHEMPSSQDQILRVDSILHLEQLYQEFYQRYSKIVQLLQDIFDNLLRHKGRILQSTEEKLGQFTHHQKRLNIILSQIQTIAPNKLESKLYIILSRVWDNYQKNSQNDLLKVLQTQLSSSQQPTQKFSFSYVVLSNKTIKYASVKFLSTYSYKQSYIVGESISMIFPSKFSLFIFELLQKNADKKIFHSQVPIVNQKGNFQIVNATFYLLPEFKGQITYIILFKKIPQLETKSLFLFNSETFCIEGFNRKIINKFKFSLDKINIALQNGAIQFSNLFVFSNEDKNFLTFAQKNFSTHTSRINRRTTQNSTQKIKQADRSSTMKAMLKMDYLSDIKKKIGKNVNLQIEISFQINNISYKVIKVQDTSSEKVIQGPGNVEKSQQINIMKAVNRNSANQLQRSTKDLKKRYENEQFFCPIPNPYLPKILQQLNSFDTPGRVRNSLLIKICFTFGLITFLGGIIGIRICSSNLQTSITQFERQAQSLNLQYSYFMESLMYAYEIHHMQMFPEQFKSYIQKNYALSAEQALDFYKNELIYLYAQKSRILKNYQNAYLDFPILLDTQTIEMTFQVGGLFQTQGTSKTSIIYDMIVLLLDSSNPLVKQILSMNFGIYMTLIKILRPDGRYDNKITKLQQTPAWVTLQSIITITLVSGLVYYWLYQLRDTKEEIISIYQLIQKKQIVASKQKISDIHDLLQTLSNNKSTISQSHHDTASKNQQFSTLSQLNSANNIGHEKQGKKRESSRSFDDENHEFQNQHEHLLGVSKQSKDPEIISLNKKKVQSPKKIGIYVQTLLKHPLYFVLLLINLGLLLFGYYLFNDKSNSYIQAFNYFQKIRGSNFQFRYLYEKSQQQAYYESIKKKQYNDTSPVLDSEKNTHFDYEKPQGFVFSIDESLCSQAIVSKITDPWFKNYQCDHVDNHILTRDFSQAYEQYERNLRQISKVSYQDLIKNSTYSEIYFNSMYEYHIFKNYMSQLSQANFQVNIAHLENETQKNLSYLLNFTIFWTVFTLVSVFILFFPKLEAETATIISLLKIIPSETLFNIKVASLIKKKNLIQKLSRL